jgi:hypothetical protein
LLPFLKRLKKSGNTREKTADICIGEKIETPGEKDCKLEGTEDFFQFCAILLKKSCKKYNNILNRLEYY